MSLKTEVELKKLVRDAEIGGHLYAMQKNHIPLSRSEKFRELLEELTGDADFGKHPLVNLSDGRSLAQQFHEQAIAEIIRITRLLVQRDERIEFLEWQLDKNKTDNLEQLADGFRLIKRIREKYK